MSSLKLLGGGLLLIGSLIGLYGIQHAGDDPVQGTVILLVGIGLCGLGSKLYED